MISLVTLVAANLAFLMGPLVLRLSRKSRKVSMFFDGLVFAAILSFCFLHILPEVVETGAYYALLFFIVGLWFPFCPQILQDRFGIKDSKGLSFAFWVMITLGFAVHVFAEGAVLASSDHGHSINMGLSVILHRLGVGIIIINFFINRKQGRLYSLGAILLLILGTTAGFFLAGYFQGHDHVHGHNDFDFLLLIEVFVAGNLLHIVSHGSVLAGSDHHDHCTHHHFAGLGGSNCDHDHGDHSDQHNTHTHIHHGEHSHHHTHSYVSDSHNENSVDYKLNRGNRLKERSGFKNSLATYFSDVSFSSYGALLVILLILVEVFYFLEPEAKASFLKVGNTFWLLFKESSIPLLLAFSFAGLMTSFIKPGHMRWLGRGNRLTQTSKGVAFGLPLPICSCGVLPLYQSLIQKGAPVSAAVAFLIATPEIGLDAIFLSFALLGPEVTLIRIVAAFVLALLVGILFSYLFKTKKNQEFERPEEPNISFKEKLRMGLNYGFKDLLDHTIPWILVGLVVAAVLENFISYDFFSSWSSVQQVLVFSIIGIPLYVCASGATPLAAILLSKGVSTGAIIAFLLAGPATNISTFGILNRLHGKKFALLFGFGVLLIAIGMGLFIDFMAFPIEKVTPSEIMEHSSLAQELASVVLALLILLSFVRQGFRHFIEQLIQLGHKH